MADAVLLCCDGCGGLFIRPLWHEGQFHRVDTVYECGQLYQVTAEAQLQIFGHSRVVTETQKSE